MRKGNNKTKLVDWELKNQLREIEHPITGKILNIFLKFRFIQIIVEHFSGDYLFRYEIFEDQKIAIDKYYDEHNFSYAQLIAKKCSIEKKKSRKYNVKLPIFISVIVTIMCNTFVSNIFESYIDILGQWFTKCAMYIPKLIKYPLSDDIVSLYAYMIVYTIIFVLFGIFIGILIYFILVLISYIIDGFKLRKYAINEYIYNVLDNKIKELESNTTDVVCKNTTEPKCNITRNASMTNISDEEVKRYIITIKEKNRKPE